MRWTCGEAGHLRAVDALEANTAAAAAIRAVAHNQVGIDYQARTRAVAQPRRAIYVGHAAAFGLRRRRAIRGRAHDDDPAAISWNGWVGTLIEQDRVMFDVAVIAEPKVSEAAAVTRAQIPAHPVVVELVVVGAGAEGDTACPAGVDENNSSPTEEFLVIGLWCTLTFKL